MTSLARPILVGLDHDGRSDPALSAALEMGRRFDAPVHAVHALQLAPILWAGADPLPVAPAIGPEVLATVKSRVAARIEDRIALSGKGVAFDLKVVLGHAAHVLLEEARALDAGLICLGPHRRRGVIDFGNTARAVLARAPTAVWLQIEEPRPIRVILAPTDLSEQSLRALAAARDLALAHGAKLEVIHVFQRPDLSLMAVDEAALPPLWDVEALRKSAREDLDRALANFDWRDTKREVKLVEGDPVQEILARQGDADLIVLGTHGRTGLSAFLLGSVAYSVLREARRPVLGIRHPERRFLTS